MRGPLTIMNDAVASNRARASINRLCFIWYYPKWPLIWIGSLSVTGLLSAWSPWFLVLAVPTLGLNLLYWVRVQEFFSHGNARPGLVLQLNPTLVAVATDLTQGWGSYPAIKVIRTRLKRSMGRRLRPGSRLPTVALYKRSLDPMCPHWEDFFPRPLECATWNKRMVARIMATFSEIDWQTLEQSVQQLPSWEPGLYMLPTEGDDQAVPAPDGESSFWTEPGCAPLIPAHIQIHLASRRPEHKLTRRADGAIETGNAPAVMIFMDRNSQRQRAIREGFVQRIREQLPDDPEYLAQLDEREIVDRLGAIYTALTGTDDYAKVCQMWCAEMDLVNRD